MLTPSFDEFVLFMLYLRHNHSTFVRIVNSGEFATKGRGEFATLCDARVAVNLPEDASGGELAHKSFKN